MKATGGFAAALAVAASTFAFPVSAQTDARGATVPVERPWPTDTDLRIGQLIGMTVHDVAGEGFGVVSDVVIDMVTRTVRYAEVSRGRDPGHVLAVTPAQLRLSVDRPGLLREPPVQERLVLRVIGSNVSAAPADPSQVSPGPLQAGLPVRGSALLNAAIVGSDGARVGSVRDVVFNADDGRMRYVVVALDRLLGRELVAIGPEAIRMPRGDGAWTVAATGAQIEQSPRYEAGGSPR